MSFGSEGTKSLLFDIYYFCNPGQITSLSNLHYFHPQNWSGGGVVKIKLIYVLH